MLEWGRIEVLAQVEGGERRCLIGMLEYMYVQIELPAWGVQNGNDIDMYTKPPTRTLPFTTVT